MPPPEGSREGAVNCEKGWMAGSQGENGTPTTFGTASDLLGEMAALWLALRALLPLSNIESGLAEYCPAFCNLHASS